LAKVRPKIRGQNVYAEDYAALEKLLPLAAEYGVAIVVVHHLRKTGAADPLDEISGSTGLSGGVDGALILKRDRGRADAYLHVTGRDIEEDAEYALRWDHTLAAWSLVGDADEYRQSEERREIIELLETTGPLEPKDVAEALDKNPSTTRVLLRKMLADGQVAVEEGGYTVVNTVNGVNATPKAEEPVYGVYGVYEAMEEEEEELEMDFSMHVRDLLSKIAERGITLTCEHTEDRLNAKPASVLTPELIAEIKEHKTEIIRIMREDEEDRLLEETGIIQSKRQVFEMAREWFGGS